MRDSQRERLSALAGLALIALSAFRLADIAVLVSVPTAMFLCVYLSCTAAAARILTGKAQAAAVAVLAVLVVLAFCGWALLAAAAIATVAGLHGHGSRGYPPAKDGWQAAAVARSVRSVFPAAITLSRKDA